MLSYASEVGGCVVHGEIIPGTDTGNMRRRSTPKPNEPATIRDRVVPYMVLDIDSLPLPEGMSVETDPEEIVRFALGRIGALKGVSCWYHHSHSAGTTRKVKLHLAFWLGAEGRTCLQLERWVKYQNEFADAKLLDPAPYSPADFIFLGNPTLSGGVSDPVPAGKRYGVIRGQEDTLYLDVPETWKPEGERRNRDQQIIGSGVGVKGVAGVLKRFGAECHDVIVDAAKAAFRARELSVDDDALADRIERALLAAKWGPERSAAYLSTEAAGIPRAVKWYRATTLATVQATPYGVPAPRFPTADTAITALDESLDSFFARLTEHNDAVIAAIGKEGVEVPPPPLMAVKATTGVGKTRGVVARLLDSPCQTILYAAPTHAVLEEIREALERESAKRPGEWVEIIHIIGRTHLDTRTKEPTMCKRAGVVSEVQRAGGDTGKLCFDKDAGTQCPFYDGCPFIEQRERLKAVEKTNTRAIYLMAVDTLPHRLPGGVRNPNLVVIDESFWGSLANEGKAVSHLKLETIRGIKWQVLDNVKLDGVLINQRVLPAATAGLMALWQQFTVMLEACEEHADSAGYFPPARSPCPRGRWTG
ncbi:hypothetical protein [Dankookia sp. P2]|uniref:hypothetical protein n=1 Tax=Dankookia sp. P2 TaxID=3423955 RepID=UPI003D674A7D